MKLAPRAIGGVLGLTALLSIPAGASCAPSRTDDYVASHFAGWQRQPGTNVGGVYANIYTYEPYVKVECPNSTDKAGCNETVEQIGIADSSAKSIGQDGFKTYESGLAYGLRDFCEVAVGQTVAPGYLEVIDNNPNQLYGYGILYAYNYDSNGQPEYTCQKSGQTFGVIDQQYQPDTGDIFGEVHTFASQMPGGTSDNDYFSNAHIYYGGGWQNYGADSANSSSDEQCVSSYPSAGGTWTCVNVGGPSTVNFNGGSDYNSNVFGTNVFENGSSENQLNIADLACTT